MPSILLLFLGNRSTDRRLQNFERFFGESGWQVEVMTVQPSVARGPRRFLNYDRLAKRAIRTKRADVVMACDLYSLGAAVHMKRAGNAKHVIYDSREVYTELPTVAHRPLVKWAWKRYERKHIDDVDLMLVTGPHDADAIRRVHSGIPRTVLVRNLPWRTELIRDRSLLRQYGLSPDIDTLIYVGGLQRGRGLTKLITAMRSLEEQLLIVGAGELEDELRALATGYHLDHRVKFAGAVPAEDAMNLIAACDAGVSLVEPISESYALALPSKVFEYMMSGIPVLSSRLRQVIELFEREEWIEFVDVNDDTDIERGIRAVLAKAGSHELSERTRALAMEKYHFAADASRLIDVLQKTYSIK